MWQYLITGLIVVAAVVYLGYHFVKSFTDPLRKCKSCTSSCSGCALEELKRTRDEGRGTKDEGRRR
ncbi:MAG: FeoB-associated Cys-rich membrane protein [Bacteroidales bacterium]|nr:FeoB-associated Cys-rich membrane protein [Bacteroidales bacterium]